MVSCIHFVLTEVTIKCQSVFDILRGPGLEALGHKLAWISYEEEKATVWYMSYTKI